MKSRKTYVILGLGRFGSYLAKELTDFNQDVIAIDKDMAQVDKVAGFVSNAVCLDYTDSKALIDAGVKDADVGIVTTGSKLDQALLGLINLKDLGVPYVAVKVANEKEKQLMYKVGADQTISPESDTAKLCAKKLISKDILEIFDIDKQNSMFDMKIPNAWINHSLKELDLRTKYALNVIGVKRDGQLRINIDPNEKFLQDDELLIVGSNDVFKKFEELNNI